MASAQPVRCTHALTSKAAPLPQLSVMIRHHGNEYRWETPRYIRRTKARKNCGFVFRSPCPYTCCPFSAMPFPRPCPHPCPHLILTTTLTTPTTCCSPLECLLAIPVIQAREGLPVDSTQLSKTLCLLPVVVIKPQHCLGQIVSHLEMFNAFVENPNDDYKLSVGLLTCM